MEAILNYFEHIPSPHRALIIVGGLTIFWIIEGIVPLFGFKYHKWKHAVLAFLFLKSSDWVMANNFGILN